MMCGHARCWQVKGRLEGNGRECYEYMMVWSAPFDVVQTEIALPQNLTEWPTSILTRLKC